MAAPADLCNTARPMAEAAVRWGMAPTRKEAEASRRKVRVSRRRVVKAAIVAQTSPKAPTADRAK